MSFFNFVMALSPIVVVLVGILGFRQSAKRVAPVALLWTLLLAFTYFNVSGASFKDNVAVYDALLWKGIKEGLKIVLMVFGAFVILNLLRDTGDRASDCGGIMEPIAVWVRKNGEWAIIHRCKRCGALSSNRVAADDNPMKLMSIAMKPLCQPPFPLERIEEMTALMGGDGRMK